MSSRSQMMDLALCSWPQLAPMPRRFTSRPSTNSRQVYFVIIPCTANFCDSHQLRSSAFLPIDLLDPQAVKDSTQWMISGRCCPYFIHKFAIREPSAGWDDQASVSKLFCINVRWNCRSGLAGGCLALTLLDSDNAVGNRHSVNEHRNYKVRLLPCSRRKKTERQNW
jgi:hypothetical protein